MYNTVDGVWSEWPDYSNCSATCDGGMQTRTRTCTNPAPSGGGANCSGSDYQCQSCNYYNESFWCTCKLTVFTTPGGGGGRLLLRTPGPIPFAT